MRRFIGFPEPDVTSAELYPCDQSALSPLTFQDFTRQVVNAMGVGW